MEYFFLSYSIVRILIHLLVGALPCRGSPEDALGLMRDAKAALSISYESVNP